MSGVVLSEEDVDQLEVYIDNAYGNAMDTLYMVGNVPMGSPEVMISIQKKTAQSLIATIKDRDKMIASLNEKLTSHAPEGHNYTNGQHVWLELENEKLRTQLAKYEHVVEAAEDISCIPPQYEAGRHTLYQVYEPEMESLRDALDSLKA